ncbi:MAG: hypothetical protein UHS49_05505 [Faecalimonas sp.]|nr:hypothetical protein [Faecalimonas sp.]
MLDTMNMAKQLHGEYKAAFEWMDIYSMSLEMDAQIKDEKLMEFYDFLVEAEYEGKSVEKIVGRDIEIFAKNLFEEKKESYGLKDLFEGLFVISFTVLLIAVTNLLLDDTKIDLLPIVTVLGIAWIINKFVKHFLQPMALKKKMKPIVYCFIALGSYLFSFVLAFIICGILDLQLYMNSWTLIVFAGAYFVTYLIIKVVLKWREGDKAYNQRKEEKKIVKEFNKEIAKDSQTEICVKMMAKRFQRIQKRRNKRGKEYTFEDFATLIRKEKSTSKKWNIVMYVCFALMVLCPSIDIILHDGILNGLVFMAIAGALEFSLCRWSIRTGDESSDMQVKIIDECEEKGIDILQRGAECKPSII